VENLDSATTAPSNVPSVAQPAAAKQSRSLAELTRASKVRSLSSTYSVPWSRTLRRHRRAVLWWILALELAQQASIVREVLQVSGEQLHARQGLHHLAATSIGDFEDLDHILVLERRLRWPQLAP
jgi:hypothetical protein